LSTQNPLRGAYSAPPDPLAGFKGPTSKGRGGRNKGEEGKEGEHCGVQKNILKIDPDLLYVYGLADHTRFLSPVHKQNKITQRTNKLIYLYLCTCSHPSCLCPPSSEIGTSLLRVARLTAWLAESDGSLLPGL